MSEIFSTIRLKDRIIIAIVMAVYAFLLAGSAGAITYASVNNHPHVYGDYHLEMTDDGDLYLMGTCTKANCKNPYDIVNSDDFDVVEKVVLEPTCSSEGKKTYYAEFNIAGRKQGFTYTEAIPPVSHLYECEIVTENGVTSVSGNCINEGCTDPTLNISGALDVKLESSVDATCTSPGENKYSYTIDGVPGSFTAVVTDENAPHILGGKPATEYQFKPGIYLYGTEGIKGASNAVPLSGCGQITGGYYFNCEDCGNIIQVIVGLPDHNYSEKEGSLTKADFNETGKVTVRCSNTGCREDKTITLPKADATNATLISSDEENRTQTWKYSYYSEKYNYTVEYEFVSDWVHDHVFVHDPSLTEAPTLYKQGKAIIMCTVDGCNDRKQIVLPKIQIGDNPANGDNSKLIIPENTELKVKTVRYTFNYVSSQISFTEVLDIEIGKTLDHKYTYHLEPLGGSFVVVGRCDQPDCQNPEYIKEENVEPIYSTTTTCTHIGEEIWSHPTDSSVKPFTFPSIVLGDHNIQCGTDDIVTMPSFSADGKANAKCVNDGCTETVQITLPKIDTSAGGNADIIEIDNEKGTQKIKYTCTQTVGGNKIVVEAELVINEAHVHEFEYELEPVDGEFVFDLVGRCTSSACSEEDRVKDVPAECIKNTVSCTDPGYQTWRYLYKGVVYKCNIINFEAEGHRMNYKTDAATTIKPTFNTPGSIVLFCNGCDTQTRTVVLPVMVENVNATKSPEYDTKREIAYLYTYVTEDNITIELIVLLSK